MATYFKVETQFARGCRWKTYGVYTKAKDAQGVIDDRCANGTTSNWRIAEYDELVGRIRVIPKSKIKMED